MAMTTIAKIFFLVIVALASQAGAKPELEHRRIIKIDGEDSGSFLRHTSASFPTTISRPRRRVTRAVQDRYSRTPGVGIHIIHTHPRTWHQARRICQEEGGDLAIINSAAESQAIAELMAKSYPHYGSVDQDYVHIGFNDLEREGHYVTIDGKSLDDAGFADWAKNEPNSESGEDCGSAYKDGRLNDISCWKEHGFACELPIVDEVVPAGPVGPQGTPGIKGDIGYPGPVGSKGDKGDPGGTGPSGPPGPAGPPGPNGTQGLNGWNGKDGSPGPAGLKGKKGESGMLGPLGPSGPVGPPGLKGSTGDQGSPGQPGSKGKKGKPGAKGTDGSPGIQGKKGSRGAPGASGNAGKKGERGQKGDPGAQGPKGVGEPGPPGPRGEPGLGYDAACSTDLPSMGQTQNRTSMVAGDTPISLENKRPKRECEEFIVKAYQQITRASLRTSAQPDGRRDSPAKTCKHLFATYPDKPNGEYWIDPNGGDVADAISVYCDAERRTTCITPESPRSPNISYAGDEREVWLSEIENGMQITYTADSDQITALQLLSKHAEQTVTYHCMNLVRSFDTKQQTNGRGLRLLAWNDAVLEPYGSRHLRYDVITDECRFGLSGWREMVITYRTNQPARLPVLDVGLRDVGKPGQRFVVEIGDVCFR